MASSATELISNDMHYENMRYVWMDIYHDSHSIKNDILKQTSKEIELIKKLKMSELYQKHRTFQYGDPLRF